MPTPDPYECEIWAPNTDRWHDEGRILHLRKPDMSPACGAKYFTCAGRIVGDTRPKCRRCEAIAKAARRKRKTRNVTRTQDVLGYLVRDYCHELYRGDTPKGRSMARAALRDAGVTVPRDATVDDMVALAKSTAAAYGFDAEAGVFLKRDDAPTR